MRQRGQIGEPQVRKGCIARPRQTPSARESAQVAVREGQDHKIRGLLPQILRDGGFLHPVGFAEDNVHRQRSVLQHSVQNAVVDRVMLGDGDQRCAPRLTGPPRAIIMMAHTSTHGLH